MADVHDIVLSIEAPAWQADLPEAAALCRRAVAAALARAGGAVAGRPLELGLLLADDDAVRALNRQWRGKDRPTNVLSFAAGPGMGGPGAPLPLGDIVLAHGVCAREAAEQGKPLADHLAHLVVHGVLHLLGHDHEAPGEAEIMEALEIDILGTIGVADPYGAADRPAA